MTDTDMQPSSASVLDTALPHRLRLHLSPSLGFRGHYGASLPLSTEVVFPRRGETGLAALCVINCVENNL